MVKINKQQIQVICKGHNNCDSKDICLHAKPHFFTKIENHVYESCLSFEMIDIPPKTNCICGEKFLRKEKLNKINNSL
jgi:hypothetical protein